MVFTSSLTIVTVVTTVMESIDRNLYLWSGTIMGKLSNRVALVTGAGTGIGRAIALAFASEGATVVLNGRREEKLREVAAEIGENRAIVISADVTSEAEVKALHETLKRKTNGKLDILVNNAGGMLALAPVAEMTLAQWQSMIDLNLTSQFLVTRQLLPMLRENGNGKIISVTSAIVNLFMEGMGSYSASKAGVESLMKTLAVEEREHNIQVNLFDPLNAKSEGNPGGEHDPSTLVGVLVDLAAAPTVVRNGEIVKPELD